MQPEVVTELREAALSLRERALAEWEQEEQTRIGLYLHDDIEDQIRAQNTLADWLRGRFNIRLRWQDIAVVLTEDRYDDEWRYRAEAVVDGLRFTVNFDGKLVLVETCEECGNLRWSAPVYSLIDIGDWLNGGHRTHVECPGCVSLEAEARRAA